MDRLIIIGLTLLCLVASCLFADYASTQVEKNPRVVAVTQVGSEKEEEEAEIEPIWKEADVEMLAKLVWGEARGCTKTEQAAVIWTVLNRVDSDDPIFPDTIEEVVTQPWQFVGYDPAYPVEPDKVALAKDVLTRWLTDGEGRVLPEEYVFFHGDGKRNYFRSEYIHNGLYWDWSLDSPYEE